MRLKFQLNGKYNIEFGFLKFQNQILNVFLHG